MHILVRNSYTAIFENNEFFPVDFYFFHILLYPNNVKLTQPVPLQQFSLHWSCHKLRPDHLW